MHVPSDFFITIFIGKIFLQNSVFISQTKPITLFPQNMRTFAKSYVPSDILFIELGLYLL